MWYIALLLDYILVESPVGRTVIGTSLVLNLGVFVIFIFICLETYVFFRLV
jgi:hypothetical protein